MICLECCQPMIPRESGAYARCCNGIGYIYSEPPLPRDRWFGVVRVREGYVYRNWFKRTQAEQAAKDQPC